MQQAPLDREGICNARMDGKTYAAIRVKFGVGLLMVQRVLREEGLLDDEDDQLSRVRTTRMCARHLRDLQREHGVK